MHCVAVRIAEGVDANNRQLAGVLEHLVVHRLVLDAPALVAGFHRAQHRVFDRRGDGFVEGVGVRAYKKNLSKDVP